MKTDSDPSGSRELISIDQMLHARPQKPRLTTRERGWLGVTIDCYDAFYNCDERYAGLDHHLITYCRSGSGRLIQTRAGTVHDSVISAGMIYLMPAGHDSSWVGDTGPTARIRVPTSLIDLAAVELGQRSVSQVEICNIFKMRDPTIEHLVFTMMAELESAPHPAQALIVDAISTAMAAHMLRRFNAFEVADDRNERALGNKDLARVTAFIEDNLDRTISLAELAEVVNVSRFHFTRLFKRSTGLTAISFVEQSRIKRAQTLISESDFPLAQIALMTGFADQSHFTRRFHRQVGCTPAAFARERGRRRRAPSGSV